MTTKIKIENEGPNVVQVTGGNTGSPATIPVNREAEVWLSNGYPITVTEIQPGVTPNLAGGPGEEGP